MLNRRVAIETGCDFFDDFNLLVSGQVTACQHQRVDLLIVGTDKEFRFRRCRVEGTDANSRNADGSRTDEQWSIDQRPQEPRIGCYRPVKRCRIDFVNFILFGWAFGLSFDAELSLHPFGHAQKRSDNRQEYQRNYKRCEQHKDQRDWQELHEFAGRRLPEQERHKCREGGRGRRDDRPEHPFRCLEISRLARGPFCHAPVGIFDNNNRAVDQHANR